MQSLLPGGTSHAARALAYRIGILTLRGELAYTLSRMVEEPLAAPYVPTFQALREEWQSVLLEETDILDALSKTQAAVDKADDGLDSFAGRVSRAVDNETDGNTRKQLPPLFRPGGPSCSGPRSSRRQTIPALSPARSSHSRTAPVFPKRRRFR